MENKYFTPDIEDIRVGYEYERFTGDYPEDEEGKWISKIYPDDFKAGNWGIEVPKNWIKYVRVPYLTKEQIEAEGWKHTAGDYFRKGKFELEFKPDGWSDGKSSYVIVIGEDLYYPQFNGECKDINTFRYICKLLKIN